MCALCGGTRNALVLACLDDCGRMYVCISYKIERVIAMRTKNEKMA